MKARIWVKLQSKAVRLALVLVPLAVLSTSEV